MALKKLNDHDSFKIFDYLFMPLKFAQALIEFMQDVQKDCQSEEETEKLKQIIADLYHCKFNYLRFLFILALMQFYNIFIKITKVQ